MKISDKKKSLFLTALLAGLLITVYPAQIPAATIEGVVIMWEDDSALKSVVVKAYRGDSLVSQAITDANGSYSIEIDPGNYHLTAIYIDKEGLRYIDQEDIEVSNQSSYMVMDFLMVIPDVDLNELESDISELSEIINNLSLQLPGNLSDNSNKSDNLNNITNATGTNKTEIYYDESGYDIVDGLFKLLYSPAAIFFMIIVIAAFLIAAKRYIKQGERIKDDVEAGEIEQETAESDLTVPDKEIEITEGMQNVMKTLTKNERSIVEIMIENKGWIRRNELSRVSGISKSSMSAALNKLKDKHVIDIDRRYTTHIIKLSEWFKGL